MTALVHHDADYEQVGFWPLPYSSLPHIPGVTAVFLVVSVCQGSELIKSAQQAAGWADAVPLSGSEVAKIR